MIVLDVTADRETKRRALKRAAVVFLIVMLAGRVVGPLLMYRVYGAVEKLSDVRTIVICCSVIGTIGAGLLALIEYCLTIRRSSSETKGTGQA